MILKSFLWTSKNVWLWLRRVWEVICKKILTYAIWAIQFLISKLLVKDLALFVCFLLAYFWTSWSIVTDTFDWLVTRVKLIHHLNHYFETTQSVAQVRRASDRSEFTLERRKTKREKSESFWWQPKRSLLLPGIFNLTKRDQGSFSSQINLPDLAIIHICKVYMSLDGMNKHIKWCKQIMWKGLNWVTTNGLQTTARAICSDALTEAECEECSKELDDYQTAADSDHEILVVI